MTPGILIQKTGAKTKFSPDMLLLANDDELVAPNFTQANETIRMEENEESLKVLKKAILPKGRNHKRPFMTI